MKTRMFTWGLQLVVVISALLLAASAQAQSRGIGVTAAPAAQRRALVIGNAAYPGDLHLRNPVHDARAMAATLRRLGFVVTERENLAERPLRVAIDAFGQSLGRDDVGLFYYSGHGAQFGGQSYLIPVDVDARSADYLMSSSVPLRAVLDAVRSAGNGSNFIFLDACRNTPRLAHTRGLAGGLAQPRHVPVGTFIGFATAPGETAQDGAGNHGPFTQALLANLADPGLTADQVFHRVVAQVYQDTGRAQRPWSQSSLNQDFYFVPRATAAAIAAPVPPTAPTPSAEQAAWDTIKASADPQDFADFLSLYPNGTYAGAAKLREEALRRQERTSVPSEPREQQAAISAQPSSRTFRDPTTGMEFVYVLGGTFTEGCVVDQSACYSDEKPTRQVTLSPFWLAKTEVTQGQWKTVMGNNPTYFKNGDNYPVEQVSWNDAQDFIRRLSAQSGQHYRLPTEAEWEYACRAGGKDVEYGTRNGELNPSLANYGNDVGQTTPVRTYPPNGLGLYDMSGNVWQWVQDVYQKDAYRSGSVTDPLNDSSGALRVDRGGGWGYFPRDVRCSYRGGFNPAHRDGFLGFRIARSP